MQHRTSNSPFPLPKTTNSWGLTSSERKLTVYAVGTPAHASEVILLVLSHSDCVVFLGNGALGLQIRTLNYYFYC